MGGFCAERWGGRGALGSGWFGGIVGDGGDLRQDDIVIVGAR